MSESVKLERTRYPGIYRRGGRYVVVWRHRGRQHKEFFATIVEAREAKAKRQAGDRRPQSRLSFADYFAEWIESYAGRTARGFTERSRDLYRRAITEHALDRWGSWRLSDIEPTDVRALYRDLAAEGVPASGVKRLRAALSAMLATALEDGLLRSNPVSGVRIAAAEPADDRAKALTREELALVLAALPAEWRPFFEFLTHTGLRISEAIGLTWRNVELGVGPRVLVREQLYEGKRKALKSRHGRRDIPLSEGMAEWLRSHRRDTFAGNEAPVFTTEVGTPLSRPNLADRVLKPAAKAAGLTIERNGKRVAGVSFHTFRHSCASLLFAEGRNVKQVAEWLGHADPAYTLRTYVHLLDAGVGDAAFMDEVTAPVGNGWATQHPETAANRHSGPMLIMADLQGKR